ncbi:MAG: efflux RND transporter periplasmic adaptor subunit [Planctomycetota bacterium]
MKRWGIAIALVAVVALTVVGTVVLNSGISVQVATAQRGKIREYIDERGNTRVRRVYEISMPQSGRIEEIALEEGDRVETDQVVARIVAKDLDTAVDEAEAVVERLEAAIVENNDVAVEESLRIQATKFVESMAKTVEAAEKQKELSEKRATYAERQLGRAQQLHDSNAQARAIAEEELENTELHYWEGQLGFRQDSLTFEAMKSIQAATALLPKMVSDYIARKQLSQAVLEKQKAEAQARLRQMAIQRERGTMRSPIDGVVLERLIDDEQYLPAGTKLITLGQLKTLEVETDVLSQDVVRVGEGDMAEVYGPAVGGGLGEGVLGTVEKVYPAGFMKVSSLGVEQQRVKVIVRFSPEVIQRLRDMGVGVEYRVRIRIFTREKSNALLVPRSALFRGPDGGWQVFAAKSRRARLRGVTVGLLNDSQAEIIDGLKRHEQVILAPETSLVNGSRIKPVEP